MNPRRPLSRNLLHPALAAALFMTTVLSGCGAGGGSGDRAPSTAEAGAAGSTGTVAAFPNPVARARLIADRPFVSPGEETLLGVTFDVAEGWHLYWNGRNDTGLCPRVRLEAPPGYSVGAIQWPAPQRKISPGRILDHVYEGTVTLVLPVTVPADAPPGDIARFRARVEWLACREACIPESAAVGLDLPVAATADEAFAFITRAAANGSGGAWPAPEEGPEIDRRFAAARMGLPGPLPAGPAGPGHAWSGSTLTISMEHAAELFFYPGVDCAELEDPIRDGSAAGTPLRLAFRGAPETIRRVTGVLEIRFPDRASAAPRLYAIDLPGPPA